VPTSAGTMPTLGPCSGVKVKPGMDVQAVIDAAPAGARICFADGLYRIGKSILPNGANIFTGSRDAILDGSVVVGTWSSVGSGTWAADIPEPDVPISSYRCRPAESKRCQWDGDMFFDGVHLKPVDSRSRLGMGTVFVDQEARKAYIAQDPQGHLVEEAVSDGIIRGGEGWTVDGLTAQRAANRAQDGAIEGSNITVRYAEIRQNHAVGVYGHDVSTIEDNYIHANGQMGFSAYGGPIKIIGNYIAHNNTDGFEWQNEAGGGKCYKCSDTLIAGNISYDNVGPGIWCDTDCTRVVIEHNRVQNNTGPGIYYEISRQGVIRDNVVSGNAFDLGSDPVLVGGGITIESSQSVNVYENSLEDNGNGIILLATRRGSGAFGPYRLEDVSVHDNLTKQLSGRTGLIDHAHNAPYFTSLGNAFQGNDYILDGNRLPFDWKGAKRTIADWTRFGEDDQGKFG